MAATERYGAIFDMDGVLIDSYEPHKRSWQLMAAEYGLEMTDEQFAATFGKPSREIIRQVWPDRVPEEQIPAMDARKEEIFRQLIAEKIPEMPGAVDLIRSLKREGFKVGIGSSGPPENVRLVIEKLNLDGLLDGVVTGMDVTRGKPDPQVFLLTAERMEIEPARCVVIEDAEHGITAAKRAGMKAVGLVGTTSAERLAHADLVIDSLKQITPETLKSLIDGRQ